MLYATHTHIYVGEASETGTVWHPGGCIGVSNGASYDPQTVLYGYDVKGAIVFG